MIQPQNNRFTDGTPAEDACATSARDYTQESYDLSADYTLCTDCADYADFMNDLYDATHSNGAYSLESENDERDVNEITCTENDGDADEYGLEDAFVSEAYSIPSTQYATCICFDMVTPVDDWADDVYTDNDACVDDNAAPMMDSNAQQEQESTCSCTIKKDTLFDTAQVAASENQTDFVPFDGDDADYEIIPI